MMTPSYMEWYRAAMANGGVVPAAGTPLQVVSQHEFAVPVVVPVNLMPGGEGMSPPGVADMGYGGVRSARDGGRFVRAGGRVRGAAADDDDGRAGAAGGVR